MRAEVRLRVPNMKERAKDGAGYPIDHAETRFRKIIEIPTFVRAGEDIELTTRSGRVLQAKVVRADLDEARELFVLACQYASRTIAPDVYAALVDDPDWQLKHLLDP